MRGLTFDRRGKVHPSHIAHSCEAHLEELPQGREGLVLVPGKTTALHDGDEVGECAKGGQGRSNNKEEGCRAAIACHVPSRSTAEAKCIQVESEDRGVSE